MCEGAALGTAYSEKLNRSGSKHVVYTDVLRVAALVGIILVHVSAYKMEDLSASDRQLRAMYAWDSVTGWAMPLFVMISGVFFLDPSRKVSYRRIWKHNIPRMVIVFLGWSLFYAVYTVLLSPQKDDITTFLTEFIKGHYHMWFLYMMVGLYVIVPVMRKISEDRKILKLFLAVISVTGFLLPGLRKGISFLEGRGGTDHVGANIVHQLLDSLDLLYEYDEFGYMLFYFAAGFFLSTIVVEGRKRVLPASGLVLAAVINVSGVVTNWVVPGFLNATGWTAPFAACCVFLLARSLEGSALFQKSSKRFAGLGKATFGAYLVHAAVIEALASPIGLTSMTFYAPVSIPVIVAIVFTTSMVVSAVMARIPFFRRFV